MERALPPNIVLSENMRITHNIRRLGRGPSAFLGAVLLTSAWAGSAAYASGSPRPQSAVATPTLQMVEFVGHGYGPGIGMGQWGGFGYAVRYHDTYEQILDHFYGGTTVGNLASLDGTPNPTVSVVILENLNLKTNVGYDPVVTSDAPFSVTSAPPVSTTPTTPTTTTPTTTPTTTTPTTTTPTSTPSTSTTTSVSSTTTSVPSIPTTLPASTTPTSTTTSTSPTSTTSSVPMPPPSTALSIPAGAAVDFRLTSDGTWDAYEGSSCDAAVASAHPVETGLTNPIASPTNMSPDAPMSALLVLCRHDGVDESLRGQIQAFDRDGYERTINLVALQSYLDGVVPAEESASWGLAGGTSGAPQGAAWGFQALEAQAVAARSYTMAYEQAGGWNGYVDICDTTLCQAYVGANFEYPTTNAAVADTPGEVRIGASSVSSAHADLVLTRYSASTGGWTSPGSFPAVSDLGDACVVPNNPLECNPDHTWRVTFSARAIERHYRSLGVLEDISVTKRNGDGSLGGRSLEVEIKGTLGTRTVSGSTFASTIGLLSDWFAIRLNVPSGSTTTTSTTTPTTTSSTTTLVPSTTTLAPSTTTLVPTTTTLLPTTATTAP